MSIWGRLLVVAIVGMGACHGGGCQRSAGPTDSRAAAATRVAPIDSLGVGESQVVVRGQVGITDLTVRGETLTFGTAEPMERRGKIARVNIFGTAGEPEILVRGQDVQALDANGVGVFWLNGSYPGMVISQFVEVSRRYHRFVPSRDTPLTENESLFGADLRADATDVYVSRYRYPLDDPQRVYIGGPNRDTFAINDGELFTTACRSNEYTIFKRPKRSDSAIRITLRCDAALAAVSNEWLVVATPTDIQIAPLHGVGQPPGPLRTLATVVGKKFAVLSPFVIASTPAGGLVALTIGNGSMMTLVASGVNTGTHLIVDANSVYWISADRTQISRTRVN